MNIRECIEQAAETGKDRPYLFFRDEETSFKEFDANINRVANGLMAIGVEKGDKVCLMLPNCPEFLYAWFGANKIGAIMVPVNTSFKAEEAKYVIDHSEAKILVVHPVFLEIVKAIRGDCEHLEKVVCVGKDTLPEAIPFTELADHSPALPPRDLGEEDIAAIVYTSGTTGFPKGVLLPHRAYVNAGEAFSLWLELTSEDRIISHNPLFHANAQFYCVIGSLVTKIPLILMEKFSASRFWDEVRRYQATVTTSIGSKFFLMQQPESDRDRDHPLRAIFLPLSPEYRKRFNVKSVSAFCMTESTIGTVSPISEIAKTAKPEWDWSRCIGMPAPHPDPKRVTEIKVVDEEDNELPVGQVGELVLRGPAVMQGYYKDPEATAKALRAGWLHTGDAAVKGEDGYYYFVDRVKDMIKVSGENVSSKEVENVINMHPSVLYQPALACHPS